MAEETNPPVEAQPEEQPMMKFAELEAMVEQQKAEDQDKGLEVSTGQEEPQAQPGQVAEDPIAKALTESGFKSVEELVKSQKEGHATITKLSQERAALQRDMEAMAAFPKMLQNAAQQGRSQAQPQPPQGQPDSLTLELFKDMAPFVDQLVAARAEEIAGTVVEKKLFEKTQLQKEADLKKNDPEYDSVKPFMIHYLKNNPHIDVLPNAFEIAYPAAKKFREEYLRKQSENTTNMAFSNLLPGVPVDKIKEAFKSFLIQQGVTGQPGESQAPTQQAPQVNPTSYVPPAGANTPPMTQKSINYDSEIATRMKGKITPDFVDEISDLSWAKAMQPQSQSVNRPRR